MDTEISLTALDLAKELLQIIQEFGVDELENHPKDGLINGKKWAKRFSLASPLELPDIFVAFLGLKRPKIQRSHKIIFLKVILDQLKKISVSTYNIIKADSRLRENI